MAYNNQEQHDYADSLEPGYRFCPTDVELIVYYLKPKIDTGRRHPNFRYYEVNIYDYGPDELTGIENTLMETDQIGKPRMAGNKTDWLMHEYTTNNPNIPRGSQEHKEDSNKLTGWVLCKIYKKEKKPAKDNVRYPEEAIVLQNQQLQDEPSPRHRRLSLNQEGNQSNGREQVPVQETNYRSEKDVQVELALFLRTSNQQSNLNIVHVRASQTFPTTIMKMSPNSVTMQPMPIFSGSKFKQQAVQDPPQAFATDLVQQSVGNSALVYYQNQSRPTSTNGFQFSCGASSSSSKGFPPAIVEPGDDDMVVPHKEDIYNNLATLDDFMTSPAQALAVYIDTSSNPMTMQQMASSQTLSDEVFQQQHVQNSCDDTPSLFNQSVIVDKNDYTYLDELMAELQKML
ncbi:NAC domain-containing protein [Artemisia annua]|uniref:NAC domain-containing protein n=1 Tax=Artemisia annua TaxID=35608 RepID=A0A2U1P5U7_ARTAN|nr:NAC domain-containing protein [Artemisia annua]